MIKKLCISSGFVSGFCLTFMTVWAFTMLDAGAVVFWSIVGGLFGGLVLGAMEEEAERIERAKRRRTRKHQIYEVK